MRRLSVPLVALIATALLLTGCGSGGGEITAKGDPAPSAGGGSDQGSGGEAIPDSGNTGDSGGTAPDLGDLPAVLGNDECTALSLAIGAGAAAAFAGPEEIAQIEAELDKVRDSIPADLQADVETVTNTFKIVQEEGLIAAGEAMSSPEVTEAQNRIQAYLETNCGG